LDQQVIDARTGVACLGNAEVNPEWRDLLVGMQYPYGIGPSMGEQSGERFTYLDPEESIVDPALGFVDIPLGRDDVVITGKEHRGTAGDEFGCMGYEAIEPAQFVDELRARGGVAVRQIQATDY